MSNYRQLETRWLEPLSFGKSIRSLVTGRCDSFQHTPLPDLIMGAGHKTHWALLALKRCFGGRTIVLMRPSLPLAFFDLCLIPRHDNPSDKDNVIETLGAINRVLLSSTRKVGRGLILLGGESRHFHWNTQNVMVQIKTLLNTQPKTMWTIAGSRRTPASCYDAIKAKIPESELVLPDEVTTDWLPQKIQESEQIWVTQDSISMIYEALTSGAKTGLIQLDQALKRSRVGEEINRLLAEGRLATLSQAAKTQVTLINEADRCAKLLLEKFEL